MQPQKLNKISICYITVCLITGTLFAGDTKPSQASNSTSSEKVSFNLCDSDTVRGTGQWEDGVYTGQSTGWPKVEVRIKVKNNFIHEIAILSDDGTPDFSMKMQESLPQQIMKAQSLDIDGISGATLSSNALKEALMMALKGKKIKN